MKSCSVKPTTRTHLPQCFAHRPSSYLSTICCDRVSLGNFCSITYLAAETCAIPSLQQMKARLGKTPEGASAPEAEEEDSQQADTDTDAEGDSGSQIDKAIYDELRARRDFGFEQDLGLELEKRNLTKEAEVTKIVDAGLEQMPGVTSSTTFLPTPDLTPREVGGETHAWFRVLVAVVACLR